MDPKTLGTIMQVISVAEALLDSNMIPALTNFFATHYQLTPEQRAELEHGVQQLLDAKRKIASRRGEIARER